MCDRFATTRAARARSPVRRAISLDLQVLQVVDDVVGLGPDRVADADQADDLPVDRDEQAGVSPRASRAFERLDGLRAEGDPLLGHQAAVADQDRPRIAPASSATRAETPTPGKATASSTAPRL